MWFVNGFVNVALAQAASPGSPSTVAPWSWRASSGITVEARAPANDQLSERVRHLAVRLQVGLNVLLHGERHVRVTDAPAERLPVDLRVPASGGVAVPHVGRSISGRPAAAASFLNRRVIVSGCGGLPSSQQNSTP